MQSLVHTNKCFMQESLMKKPMLLGRMKNSLYYVKNQSYRKASKIHTYNVATKSQMINDIKMWHLRLGHIPFHSLQMLFPDLQSVYIKDILFCTIYPLAKQSRLSFSSSSIKTSVVFQLLHIDVWGPLIHPSRHKCSIFITIVDFQYSLGSS